MMFSKLSPKQNAFIAVNIFLLACILVFSITIIPAVLMQKNLIEHIDELELQRIKYKNIVANTKSLKQEIEHLKKANINEEKFLQKATNSLAAAELQQKIKLIIESSKGKLLSSQPIDSYEDELYPKITIRVRLHGNINALQKILYQFESGELQVFIDKITVKKISKNNRKNRTNNMLDARLDVSAYLFIKKT